MSRMTFHLNALTEPGRIPGLAPLTSAISESAGERFDSAAPGSVNALNAEPNRRLEDPIPNIGESNPCYRLIRGAGCVRSHNRIRPCWRDKARTDAASLVGQAFDTARLVRRGVVRSRARVRQLAHPQRAVRERLSVHARNLGERRRACVYVDHRVTERAALPGLSRMETGRRLMVGVAEHFAGLRAQVAA